MLPATMPAKPVVRRAWLLRLAKANGDRAVMSEQDEGAKQCLGKQNARINKRRKSKAIKESLMEKQTAYPDVPAQAKCEARLNGSDTVSQNYNTRINQSGAANAKPSRANKPPKIS